MRFASTRSTAIWLLALVCLAVFGLRLAQAEFRTWTAAAGGFKTEAEFVELRDGGVVRLRLRSGVEKDIPLAKLSQADQDYARSQATAPATARSDRVAKLERDVDRCDTAEEGLRLYRVFRDDPQTTDAEREAIKPGLVTMQGLAEKKMIRMAGKWATPDEFRERRNKANSLMKQGLELLRLKQEDAFRTKFAEAARVEPECIRADFMIGMLYSMLSSNYTKSKQYFDACAKREPDNVAVLNNVALAAMRRGDMNTAVANWRKAIKLGPNQCIMQNLGRCMDQASKKKLAVPKAMLDNVVNMYATLLGTEKFERADLKRGWMWMFIDEESMSLAKEGSKDKQVESPAPKAAEDGSVVISGGTGFVVFPHYLLTNNHVVDKGTSFDIQTSEGSKDKLLKATLVARSEKPDLAILHCPDLDAQALPIDPAVMRRGTDIMTFGYPEMFVLGASLKATRGVISAVPSSAVEDMYLYDAVINHGNSGGPVCDHHGNVVAVTTVMTNTEGKYGGGIPGAAALAFVEKNVPGYNRLEAGVQTLEWPEVDQQVSPSTVLVWTRSKTPSASAVATGAGFYEDRDCLVCNGLGILKCGAPGCNAGVVVTRSSRSISTSACAVCGGKALVRCPVCSGTGIDPDCVRIQPTTPPPSPPPSTGSRPGPSNRPGDQPPSDGSSIAWKNYPVNDALFENLRTAVRAGQVANTPLMGGGQQPFREVCTEGGFLIGLYMHFGQNGNTTLINSIKPVFYTKTGRDSGGYHGARGGVSRHIVAKPGYAIGAVRVRAGLGIDSLSVIFMRIQGDRLIPGDSYESATFGGSGGTNREPTTLGGTGSMIVGIHGKTPNDPAGNFLGLGLVTVAGN